MNEYLVIRLGALATDPVHWLVWSESEQEVIASGCLLGAAQLSQLQERAGGRPVIVLISAACVLFKWVSLPGKLTRQTYRALPFLLEEEVASDVEDLHLVVLGQRNKELALMAVDRHLMQQWLDWLDAAGLTTKQLVPDVLALPWQDGEWSAVQIDDQWLFRSGEFAGMQVESGWLAPLLGGFDPLPQIASYSAIPDQALGSWRAEPAELAMRLLAIGVRQVRANLLSGPYRIQPEWQRLWRPWRKVAIAAAILLGLGLVNRLVYLQEVRAETAQLRTQSVQVYQQLFPNEKRVVNPRLQMRQHLQALDGQGQQVSLLRQLTLLSPILAELKQIKPDMLRYDASRSELRLQASATGYQDFEVFRQRTEAQFDVKTTDMKNENGKVQATVLLRSKS